MPKILILLLLLTGIGVGVFALREGNFNLTPSASLAGITFVDEKNNPIKESSALEVKVALSAPWPASSKRLILEDETPKEAAASEIEAFEKDDQTSQGRNKFVTSERVKISGKFIDENGKPFLEGKLDTNCREDRSKITYQDGSFYFELKKSQGFCLRAKNIAGYKVLATNSELDPKPRSYERQVAGINCNDPLVKCPNWAQRKRDGVIPDLASDNNFVFTYTKTATTRPTPSSKPKETPQRVITKSVVLSDNPNFLEVKVEPTITNRKSTSGSTLADKNNFPSGIPQPIYPPYTYEIPYLNDPLITFYKFRECDNERPCQRILYAKFKASNGDEKIYSQTIQIVKSSGSPTPQSLVTCDFSKKTENYGCPDGFTCYQTGMPVCIGENCPKPSKQYCQPIVSDKPGSEDGSVACTQDAKLCPDGKTYVSRSGSKCEFSACPE